MNIGGNTTVRANINGAGITLENTIREFSTDGTFSDNSDLALPTEKAAKTYIGTTVSAADEWIRTGTLITPKTTGDTLGIDTVRTESGAGAISVTNDVTLSGGQILKVDEINESTGSAGVTFDHRINAIGDIQTDNIYEQTGSAGITVNHIIDAQANIKTDQISESTGSAGIIANHIIDAQANINTDQINESTGSAGITVNHIIDAQANIKTDQISESTGSAGIIANHIIDAQANIKTDQISESTGSAGIIVNHIIDAQANIKTDQINESTGSAGIIIANDTSFSANVEIDSNDQGTLNKTFSCAGLVSGGAVTDGGSGTVNIAEAIVYFRETNSNTGVLALYTIAASAGVGLTNNSENYIYCDFNGVSAPIFNVTTTGSTIRSNENDLFEIAEVYREGTTVHITPHFQFSSNVNKRVQRFLYAQNRTIRTSGLITTEGATRYLELTEGKVWVKLNEITIAAKDTSAAGRFSTWYVNSGTWTETTGQQQWPNEQYNNIASGLVNLTNVNRHSFLDCFIESDDHWSLVYATAEYLTQGAAEIAPVLSTLPGRLGADHIVYVGRLTFKKSGATLESILNPFGDNLNFSTSNDHGGLGGLLDDDHTQYYNTTRLTDGTLTSLTTNTITGGTNAHSLVIGNNTNLRLKPAASAEVRIYGNVSDGDARLVIRRDTINDINELSFKEDGNLSWIFRQASATEDLVMYNTDTTVNALSFAYATDIITVGAKMQQNTAPGVGDDLTNKTYTDGLITTHEGASTHADIATNSTHRTSNGTDHSYINQDVTSTATPSFVKITINPSATNDGLEITGNATNGDSFLIINKTVDGDEGNLKFKSNSTPKIGIVLAPTTNDLQFVNYSTSNLMAYFALADDKFYLKGGSAGVTDILDEDNMASDSNVALATQQSIKKYGDDLIVTHNAAFIHSNIAVNLTHKTSNGTDHSYINQDVTSTGVPSFGTITLNPPTTTTGLTINGNATSGDALLDLEKTVDGDELKIFMSSNSTTKWSVGMEATTNDFIIYDEVENQTIIRIDDSDDDRIILQGPLQVD